MYFEQTRMTGVHELMLEDTFVLCVYPQQQFIARNNAPVRVIAPFVLVC